LPVFGFLHSPAHDHGQCVVDGRRRGRRGASRVQRGLCRPRESAIRLP
jgi:hypothetical protein